MLNRAKKRQFFFLFLKQKSRKIFHFIFVFIWILLSGCFAKLLSPSQLNTLIFEFVYNSYQMSEILYHDNQVTVYKELIVIKKYYFPLATSRTILFSQIERITLLSSIGIIHRWGVCSKHLNNWFPLDTNRQKKINFIQIVVKGRKMRPSITPDDPEKVFRIIWQNFTPEGKEYVERMSEKAGKQTQIAQQELMQREQQMHEISEQQLSKGNPKAEQIEG